MTATAFALEPNLDPRTADCNVSDLDYLGNGGDVAPRRPQLRLIEGQGYSHVVPRNVAQAPLRPATSVEVYRRRRFFALVVVTIVVLAAAWASGISVLSFDPVTTASAEPVPAVHTVLPGDSYAAIAASFGAADPIAAAEQLRAANGGAELVTGQLLVVDLGSVHAASTVTG